MNATVEQAASVASLADKIALVTGATSTFGIGRVSARAMAMAGAYVYVTGRDPVQGAETVAEIEAVGGKTSFLKLDVTVEEDWAQSMAAVREQFGRLDILVNNAGNSISGLIEELPLDTVWYLAHLNIEGAFLGTTYAWPLMQDSGGRHPGYQLRCRTTWIGGRYRLPQFEGRPVGFEQSRRGRRAAPWHQGHFDPSRQHLDAGHGTGASHNKRGIRQKNYGKRQDTARS